MEVSFLCWRTTGGIFAREGTRRAGGRRAVRRARRPMTAPKKSRRPALTSLLSACEEMTGWREEPPLGFARLFAKLPRQHSPRVISGRFIGCSKSSWRWDRHKIDLFNGSGRHFRGLDFEWGTKPPRNRQKKPPNRQSITLCVGVGRSDLSSLISTHAPLTSTHLLPKKCRSPPLKRSPSSTAVRRHLPFHAFERLPRSRCSVRKIQLVVNKDDR